MSGVTREIVDGVPVFWHRVPGPLRAGLLLRMGWADETLLTRGIGHMLEHLALHGIRRPGDHSNGQVDASTTAFVVSGDDSEVADFLRRLTAQLAAPPMERIADEVRVLASEAAGRSAGPVDRMLSWRHGAQSYGLASHSELGVRTVTPQAIADWSHRFANRSNAALWLSGPPPAGLRLHLPDGEHQESPDPTASILVGSPAWFTGPPDGVALHAVVPRGWPSLALSHVLNTRLMEELRVTKAVAYSPAAAYRAISANHGWLTAGSDLVSGRQSEGVRPLLAMLGRLAGEGEDAVTETDLDAYRTDVRRAEEDPSGLLNEAVGAAYDCVFRARQEDEDRLTAMKAVSAQEVRAVAAQAMGDLVAEVPSGLGPRRNGWVAQPATQLDPVEGTTTRHLEHASNGKALVYGPAGLSLTWGNGGHLTAPVAATAAVQRWKDGRRLLITTESTFLDIEPTMWVDGPAITAFIDRTWPEDTFVDMGERGLTDIPRPRPAAVADPIPAPPRRQFLQRPKLLALLVLMLGAACYFTILLVGGQNVILLIIGTSWLTIYAYRFAAHRWSGGAR